jgi:hypothetical protein
MQFVLNFDDLSSFSYHNIVNATFCRVRKRCKPSLEAKRKQRLSRNKKKKILHQHSKKVLFGKVEKLKAENKVMEKAVKDEKTMKEKYF